MKDKGIEVDETNIGEIEMMLDEEDFLEEEKRKKRKKTRRRKNNIFAGWND